MNLRSNERLLNLSWLPSSWLALCCCLSLISTKFTVDAGGAVMSSYVALEADARNIVSEQTLLRSSIVLPSPTNLRSSIQYDVVFGSDGRWYPDGGAPVSIMFITVDIASGSSCFISANNSRRGFAGPSTAIDWENSLYPSQHSYSLVAGLSVTVERSNDVDCNVSFVLGSYPASGGGYAIGAASNLYVIVFESDLTPNASSSVVSNWVLSQDSPTFAFNVSENADVLPTFPVVDLSLPSPASRDVFALSSGRSYQEDGSNHQGDAVWFITANHITDVIDCNETMRADNDLWVDAEAGNAPMFTHSHFSRHSAAENPVSSVQLMASAESWGFCCNQVHYRVGAGSSLVVVVGDTLPVKGSVSLSSAVNVPNTYVCVGSSSNWPGCPPVGTTYTMLHTTILIPHNHSGIVFFSFKTLVQADQHDTGGVVAVQLALDGQRVGSTAVQQLQSPDCVSTRTLTATYVTPPASRLLPGPHNASVLVDITGSFIHLAMEASLPLVWFG